MTPYGGVVESVICDTSGVELSQSIRFKPRTIAAACGPLYLHHLFLEPGSGCAMERREFLALAAAGLGAHFLGTRAQAASPLGSVGCLPAAPGVVRCTNEVNEIDLAEAADAQHASEWCWAACISMVFSYYGHPVSQERIVQETFGVIENWPAQPGHILTALNRAWKDDDGDIFRARGDAFSVNISSIGQDLKDGHPVIIGALGHAMILKSWTYLLDVYGRWQIIDIRVLDPWPMNPRERSLSWPEVVGSNFGARIRVD